MAIRPYNLRWWCIVMVKEVWGDGDSPAHPSGGGECGEMGSVGKIKKYISSPLPCRTTQS
ncbi:MAG: hypothetical protein F6K23_32930 [Okeania sp. SIO2C9]|uniref:hypothetical protein n=1 Tax=Okeania sp. SIO2C9 TaxID=2607791 RepID=UPI0013C12940|nr:hypothetical protein [Okeania sp. SIO2C9]NEQ77397.1 hypothetical protein [Okeania sp. SIO2C9]